MSDTLSKKTGGVPTKLLWVDLEMTGLDPKHDVIVEVAAIVTDFELNQLPGEYQQGVLQDEEILKTSDWLNNGVSPEYGQQLRQLSLAGQPPKKVEQALISLIDKHWDNSEEGVILAGNSIHTDRAFIREYWPDLDARLHYRMLDVSAWKVYMQGRYGVEYKKQESHRALDDVRESIEELRHYSQMIHER